MSEGGVPPAESEPPPGRPLRLSILLVVLLVMNVVGFSRGLVAREQLLAEIPKLTPLLFNVWLAAPPVAIAGILGLWNLRRWGLYLIGLSWVAVVIVDVQVGATPHAIISTGLMWLVVLFVRPVRGGLR